MAKTYRLQSKDYSFAPMASAVDETPLQLVFALYGHAVAACTRLEHLVSVIAIHVNKEAANKALHEADPSENARQMLKLVRRWLSKHPEYTAVVAGGDVGPFYDYLFKDIDLRNELVHGFMQSVDWESETFILHHMKRIGPDEWRLSSTKYEFELVRRLAKRARIATQYFDAVAQKIFAPENAT